MNQIYGNVTFLWDLVPLIAYSCIEFGYAATVLKG